MNGKTSIQELAEHGALLRRIRDDNSLGATHVSLFTALFIQWQQNGYASPFAVTRRELMDYSKIASVATYHKCIRELDTFGYIIYQPSFHPQKGSLVYWKPELNVSGS
ncbi:MAG TPA: hypothetical protein VGI43_12920 [Mucilaginibacter sp.]|jgi:hypothetical protein